MKEIQAYQSDDGSFVGTKEQVLEYEKKQQLCHLFNYFCNDKNEVGDYWFGDAVTCRDYTFLISYLEYSPDFREFVKIVYNFKD